MLPAVVDSSVLEDGPVVADVRWYLDGRSGRAAYESGHIPGAVFIDLDRWLAGPPFPGAGRHPLPDPETFAEGMRQAGISDDSLVVAYDDAGGTIAARLVWMLRILGTPAALLDGGLAGYPGELVKEGRRITPGTFSARPWPPARLASLEDALSRGNVVVDARPPERYRGDVEPVDARAGHIPAAVSLPCRDNLDPSGRFLGPGVLRKRFEGAGAGGTNVVSYCGSGVTACHNLLALELAGLGPGRLYPGSWSEYAGRPDLPVELGEGRST
jgi:thiosulfate/3-mercaptopyruvate sulfurtransferase